MRSIAPFLRICNQQIVAGRRPWYSLNLSYRPYGRYLVMVLRDPLTMLVAISFTAYRDDRLAKKELWVTAILLHKKAVVVPVGTTNAYRMLPWECRLFGIPRGATCVRTTRDWLPATISSFSFYLTKTLTALAFRNPYGMSPAHAACDLLLLGCRAFGNYFTKTFF